MWSVGCILGELLGGKPMFPGTSTMNQVSRAVCVCAVCVSCRYVCALSLRTPYWCFGLAMVQLVRIIELTGPPSAEDIAAIRSPYAATMLESLTQSKPRCAIYYFCRTASPSPQ